MEVPGFVTAISSTPPTRRYSWQNGTIRRLYITDADQADAEMSSFKGPSGIDIEWKPNFRKGEAENPVALLQLANAESILLLHLCHMSHFPPKLQAFLEDPSIVKAGVGIQGDAKKIHKDCSVDIRNCVDLSLLARSVDNARWKGKYRDPIGLARLIAAYEDRLLSKGKITRSNWENYLDAEQQEYASNDGHAGYALYVRLSSMIQTMPKSPNPVCYTFDAIRGRLCESSGMTWTPFNPDYDSGPPPPLKPAPEKGGGSSTSSGSVALIPGTLGSSRLKRSLASDSGSSARPSFTTSRDNQIDEPSNSKRPKRHRPRKHNRPTVQIAPVPVCMKNINHGRREIFCGSSRLAPRPCTRRP